MTYKILSIQVQYESGQTDVKTMKQITDADGNPHNIGLHIFSIPLDAPIVHLPQNVQDVITQARTAYTQ